jgi:hypothetical protein
MNRQKFIWLVEGHDLSANFFFSFHCFELVEGIEMTGSRVSYLRVVHKCFLHSLIGCGWVWWAEFENGRTVYQAGSTVKCQDGL